VLRRQLAGRVEGLPSIGAPASHPSQTRKVPIRAFARNTPLKAPRSALGAAAPSSASFWFMRLLSRRSAEWFQFQMGVRGRTLFNPGKPSAGVKGGEVRG
jgi:hypothetical protein